MNLTISGLTAQQHDRLVKAEIRCRPPSESDFVSLLEEDIAKKITLMENSSDKHFYSMEDDITNEIVGALITLGYDASEQTKTNGAVDITVKNGDYKWIAEAKIGNSDYAIFEGFLQLLTRYIKRDTQAGVLIYYKKIGATIELSKFVTYLKEKKWKKSKLIANSETAMEIIDFVFDEIQIINKTDNSFTLLTKTTSGNNIKVKVFSADFYFCPVDKSGRNAGKINKNAAHNELMILHQQWKESNYEELNLDTLKCVLSRISQYDSGDYLQ
ncbi:MULTISPECIES: hypothetical protein [Shewanella]|uniref:hypothetical protein n=1 Tax=Shewanella TaxID=22 RepID=UPI00201A7FE6|nr:hypothetical protein [Shewanella sp. 10B]